MKHGDGGGGREELSVEVANPVQQQTAAGVLTGQLTPRGGTCAVLVCHGMGRQVRFETLDCVAKALLARDQPAAGTRASASPSVKLARFADDWVPRTEIELGGDDPTRSIHLYEAYWAPLTEGKVSGRDVVNFLLAAGWNGIAFSIRGVFDRWMFGGQQKFVLSAFHFFHLGIATLAVCALAIGYVMFWLLGGAVAFRAISGWPLTTAVATLRIAAVWCALILAGVLVAGVASLLLKRLFGRPARGDRHHARREGRRIGPVAFGILVLALAVIVLGSALLASALTLRVPTWLALYLLLAAGLAVLRLRWVLVQYVGDVAAYVSSHSVNKFHELRKKIQDVSYSLAQNVYGARRTGSEEFEYDEVIIAGHSLGSVVAYDTLNEMLRRDIVALDSPSSGASLKVAERTRLLLTFGSPLDKTAFIFRTQKRDALFREALAAAMQPLIMSYDNRPREWVNIWSQFDWISGRVEYYDLPGDTAGESARRVRNIEENGSIFPTSAHTDYWERKAFGDTLYRAITQPLEQVINDQSGALPFRQ